LLFFFSTKIHLITYLARVTDLTRKERFVRQAISAKFATSYPGKFVYRTHEKVNLSRKLARLYWALEWLKYYPYATCLELYNMETMERQWNIPITGSCDWIVLVLIFNQGVVIQCFSKHNIWSSFVKNQILDRPPTRRKFHHLWLCIAANFEGFTDSVFNFKSVSLNISYKSFKT
jgi:hypothetical protein